MTTKEVTRNCKKCGYKQVLKNTSKKRKHWACSNCYHRNKLRLSAITALIAVLAISGISHVYAEQQVGVNLPYDTPFVNNACSTSLFSTGGQSFAQYTCYWNWEITNEKYEELTDKSSTSNQDPEGWSIALGEAIRLGVNSDEEPEETPDVEVEEETPSVPQTPEQKARAEALKALDDCKRGFENEYSHAWGAIQASGDIPFYQNATRGEFAERDNLSKNQSVLKTLKAIAECEAMREALDRGVLGSREARMAYDDIMNIGKDNQPAQGTRGHEESRGFADEKSASDEEKLEQANEWKDWACKESNSHLGLCRANLPLTGDNRGFSEPAIGGDYNNVNIFAEGGDPQTGKGILDPTSCLKLVL
jgi:ssDNA-binding Zn-finger/Zn-ribbon topoisomerase 1